MQERTIEANAMVKVVILTFEVLTDSQPHLMMVDVPFIGHSDFKEECTLTYRVCSLKPALREQVNASLSQKYLCSGILT